MDSENDDKAFYKKKLAEIKSKYCPILEKIVQKNKNTKLSVIYNALHGKKLSIECLLQFEIILEKIYDKAKKPAVSSDDTSKKDEGKKNEENKRKGTNKEEKKEEGNNTNDSELQDGPSHSQNKRNTQVEVKQVLDIKHSGITSESNTYQEEPSFQNDINKDIKCMQNTKKSSNIQSESGWKIIMLDLADNEKSALPNIKGKHRIKECGTVGSDDLCTNKNTPIRTYIKTERLSPTKIKLKNTGHIDPDLEIIASVSGQNTASKTVKTLQTQFPSLEEVNGSSLYHKLRTDKMMLNCRAANMKHGTVLDLVDSKDNKHKLQAKHLKQSPSLVKQLPNKKILTDLIDNKTYVEIQSVLNTLGLNQNNKQLSISKSRDGSTRRKECLIQNKINKDVAGEKHLIQTSKCTLLPAPKDSLLLNPKALQPSTSKKTLIPTPKGSLPVNSKEPQPSTSKIFAISKEYHHSNHEGPQLITATEPLLSVPEAAHLPTSACLSNVQFSCNLTLTPSTNNSNTGLTLPPNDLNTVHLNNWYQNTYPYYASLGPYQATGQYPVGNYNYSYLSPSFPHHAAPQDPRLKKYFFPVSENSHNNNNVPQIRFSTNNSSSVTVPPENILENVNKQICIDPRNRTLENGVHATQKCVSDKVVKENRSYQAPQLGCISEDRYSQSSHTYLNHDQAFCTFEDCSAGCDNEQTSEKSNYSADFSTQRDVENNSACSHRSTDPAHKSSYVDLFARYRPRRLNYNHGYKKSMTQSVVLNTSRWKEGRYDHAENNYKDSYTSPLTNLYASPDCSPSNQNKSIEFKQKEKRSSRISKGDDIRKETICNFELESTETDSVKTGTKKDRSTQDGTESGGNKLKETFNRNKQNSKNSIEKCNKAEAKNETGNSSKFTVFKLKENKSSKISTGDDIRKETTCNFVSKSTGIDSAEPCTKDNVKKGCSIQDGTEKGGNKPKETFNCNKQSSKNSFENGNKAEAKNDVFKPKEKGSRRLSKVNDTRKETTYNFQSKTIEIDSVETCTEDNIKKGCSTHDGTKTDGNTLKETFNCIRKNTKNREKSRAEAKNEAEKSTEFVALKPKEMGSNRNYIRKEGTCSFESKSSEIDPFVTSIKDNGKKGRSTQNNTESEGNKLKETFNSNRRNNKINFKKSNQSEIKNEGENSGEFVKNKTSYNKDQKSNHSKADINVTPRKRRWEDSNCTSNYLQKKEILSDNKINEEHAAVKCKAPRKGNYMKKIHEESQTVVDSSIILGKNIKQSESHSNYPQSVINKRKRLVIYSSDSESSGPEEVDSPLNTNAMFTECQKNQISDTPKIKSTVKKVCLENNSPKLSNKSIEKNILSETFSSVGSYDFSKEMNTKYIKKHNNAQTFEKFKTEVLKEIINIDTEISKEMLIGKQCISVKENETIEKIGKTAVNKVTSLNNISLVPQEGSDENNLTSIENNDSATSFVEKEQTFLTQGEIKRHCELVSLSDQNHKLGNFNSFPKENKQHSVHFGNELNNTKGNNESPITSQDKISNSTPAGEMPVNDNLCENEAYTDFSNKVCNNSYSSNASEKEVLSETKDNNNCKANIDSGNEVCNDVYCSKTSEEDISETKHDNNAHESDRHQKANTENQITSEGKNVAVTDFSNNNGYKPDRDQDEKLTVNIHAIERNNNTVFCKEEEIKTVKEVTRKKGYGTSENILNLYNKESQNLPNMDSLKLDKINSNKNLRISVTGDELSKEEVPENENKVVQGKLPKPRNKKRKNELDGLNLPKNYYAGIMNTTGKRACRIKSELKNMLENSMKRKQKNVTKIKAPSSHLSCDDLPDGNTFYSLPTTNEMKNTVSELSNSNKSAYSNSVKEDANKVTITNIQKGKGSALCRRGESHSSTSLKVNSNKVSITDVNKKISSNPSTNNESHFSTPVIVKGIEYVSSEKVFSSNMSDLTAKNTFISDHAVFNTQDANANLESKTINNTVVNVYSILEEQTIKSECSDNECSNIAQDFLSSFQSQLEDRFDPLDSTSVETVPFSSHQNNPKVQAELVYLTDVTTAVIKREPVEDEKLQYDVNTNWNYKHKDWKHPTVYTEMLTSEKLGHFYKCMDHDCNFTHEEENVFVEHLKCHVAASGKLRKNHSNTWKLCSYCCDELQDIPAYLAHLRSMHGSCHIQCRYCFYRVATVSEAFSHQENEHAIEIPHVLRCFPDSTPDHFFMRNK